MLLKIHVRKMPLLCKYLKEACIKYLHDFVRNYEIIT